MRDEGRTILFVTHDMQAVNRFCHRALLLERGEVIAIGDPKEVTGRVHGGQLPRGAGRGRHRAGRASSTTARRTSRTRGSRTSTASGASTSPTGDPCACKVRVEFNWELRGPGLALVDRDRRAARTSFATSSAWTRARDRQLRGRRAGRLLGRVREPPRARPLLRLAAGRAARGRGRGRRRPPRPGGGFVVTGAGEPRQPREPAARLHASSASACASCRHDARARRASEAAGARAA